MTRKPNTPGSVEADLKDEIPAPKDDWELMDSAPIDGRAVIVADDKFQNETEAYFRVTKKYDASAGKWEERKFWAVRNAAGRELPFEPAAWRSL